MDEIDACRLAAARAHAIAIAMQSHSPRAVLPPQDGLAPRSEQVLPSALFRGTRGYIEKTVAQINITYETGSYDATAVLVRRLIETLLIEVYEARGEQAQVKGSDGNYLQLSGLIAKALGQSAWGLGRNTKAALHSLKQSGDLSAHSRRYNALRTDIDDVKLGLRVAAEELLHLAGLK